MTTTTNINHNTLVFTFESQSQQPPSFGAVFISRPLTVQDGKLVEGPTSRFLKSKQFKYQMLDRSICCLGLETFLVLDGTGKEIGRRIPKGVEDVSMKPNGHINFSRGGAEVAKTRTEVLGVVPGDGKYVIIGAVVGTKLTVLSRDGECFAMGGVVEARLEAVALADFQEGVKYTAEYMQWVKQRLGGSVVSETNVVVVPTTPVVATGLADDGDDLEVTEEPEEVIFISGSRSIERLSQEMVEALESIPATAKVVVGDCPAGVDVLVQKWLKEHNHADVTVYHIGEPRFHLFSTLRVEGRKQLVKDRAMADACTKAFAFWDGVSPGTKANIDYLRSLNKPVQVIQFTPAPSVPAADKEPVVEQAQTQGAAPTPQPEVAMTNNKTGGFQSLVSPLNVAFKARKGAKLVTPTKRGEAAKAFYGEAFASHLVSLSRASTGGRGDGAIIVQADAFAVLSMAAGAEAKVPAKGHGINPALTKADWLITSAAERGSWCELDHTSDEMLDGYWRITPPCLTSKELVSFLKWLATQVPALTNTGGNPVPTLVLEPMTDGGTLMRLVAHEYIINETGVFLKDGRNLNHVIVDKGGRTTKNADGTETYHPGELSLVSSYGWFAVCLARLIPDIIAGKGYAVGTRLNRELPFAASSGTAGGTVDNDRLRWESGQYIPFKWNDCTRPGKDGKLEQAGKSPLVNRVFREWGLVPMPNGNFVDGRLVAPVVGGQVTLMSNKLTKLAKRISQQYSVCCMLEGAETKSSVIAWNGTPATKLPSQNVWRERVCIATGLISPPGAIFELYEREERLINTVSFTEYPTYEVDPKNPLTPVEREEGVTGMFREGEVVLQLNTVNGPVPVRIPTDCESYVPHKVEITDESGYPRVKFTLRCTRRERANKYRGTLKGVGTQTRLTIFERKEMVKDGKYLTKKTIGGTNARLVIPADANKSWDSILGPLDYVAETAFHPANAQDKFCQELKAEFLAMNTEMFGANAPTGYAVLNPDFHARYEEIIARFMSYFGQAKWFVYEAAPEFAEVMMGLRVTDDGEVIKGWRKVAPCLVLPHGGVADGDPADPKTNILGTYVEGGVTYVAQRTFCLDEVNGAAVYWPVKVEYSTVRQAVGTSRAMLGQVIETVRAYPRLAEEWLTAGTDEEIARGEVVKAYLAGANSKAEVFDGVLVGDKPLKELVAELPKQIKVTGIDGESRFTMTFAPHALAVMAGEGKDALALPELFRTVLGSEGAARYRALRRFDSVIKSTLEGNTFWKGGMGPRGVTAKVMGLPHIPFDKLVVKASKSSDSVYQKMLKLWGNKLSGTKVLLGRAPMMVMTPLEVLVIDKNHPDYQRMHAELIYVNALVSAFNGGDYDGDPNYVYKGDQKAPTVTLKDLMRSLVQRTGSNQLASTNDEGVTTHGDKYLGDWYEIKRVEKHMSKRKGFHISVEEAATIFEEAESQHTEMVGSMFSAGILAMMEENPFSDAIMDVYEEVLGGLNRELYFAWCQSNNGNPEQWLKTPLFPALQIAIQGALEASKEILKAARKAKPEELGLAMPAALLQISRGEIGSKLLLAYRHTQGAIGDGLLDRILLRWAKALGGARIDYEASLKRAAEEDYGYYEDYEG